MNTGGRGGPPGGHRGGPPARPANPFPVPNDETLKAIIEQGDPQTLARSQDRGDKVSTSQIRTVFAAVRQIETRWPPAHPSDNSADSDMARRGHRNLLLLKPKMAYQAARSRGGGVDNLRRVLDPAIDKVRAERDRFQNFVDFFEAILAYHRHYGGQ